jgi:hypothetical protein
VSDRLIMAKFIRVRRRDGPSEILVSCPIPEAAVPERPPALGLDHTDKLGECESQVDFVPGVGFREETL